MSENGNLRWRNELVRIEASMRVLLTSAGLETEGMHDLLKCGIQSGNIKVFDLHTGMGLDELRQYDVVYLCGGSTSYLLERINATGFHMILTDYIRANGMVIGVSAGSLIFADNLAGNLGLIDTRLDVHCPDELEIVGR